MHEDDAGLASNATGEGPHPIEERLFDVRIRPYRSATPGAMRGLIAIFALVALASSVPFILMGAWPVGGFMGLDILLLAIAFRSNFRAARAYEDVVLTPLELLLTKVSPKGHRREWRFNPLWVRLDRDEHVEFGLLRLSLRSKGSIVEVAGFLGPEAKADFATHFGRALGVAKRGPRYS